MDFITRAIQVQGARHSKGKCHTPTRNLFTTHSFFNTARSAEPAFYSSQEDYWVVMRYDDIIQIFKEPDTFSPANARHPAQPLSPAAAAKRDRLSITIEPCLVDEAPEIHRKHRCIFGDAFTPRRVNQIEGQVREIVTRSYPFR